MTAGGVTLKKGDIITIDGAAGEVMAGAVPMIKPELTGEFGTLMAWADEVRRMKVRANAETPADARTARSFGAEGIGLCRTEHMFFEGDRIVAMREMILAETEEGRRAALAKLLPMQRQDFAELFEIMSGLPVTIRLLDPPLHEFLPKTDAEMDEVSKGMGVPVDKLRARAAELHEFNPMLGFRGIRLAVAYPEIAEMQARAIFLGAVDAGKKTGKPVTAEIMLPVIFGKQEFDLVKPIIVAAAEAVGQGDRGHGAIPGRHHDRAAARGAACGRDRRERRVLLVRHQRPDPDDARHLARRRRLVPRPLHDQEHLGGRSVRVDRHGRRRRTDQDRGRTGQGDTAQHQARGVRRAWRRSGFDRLLRRRAVSTMCRARRSASRSPGWRRRRPRCTARRIRPPDAAAFHAPTQRGRSRERLFFLGAHAAVGRLPLRAPRKRGRLPPLGRRPATAGG